MALSFYIYYSLYRNVNPCLLYTSSLAVLADPFEGFGGSAEVHSVVGGAWFAAGQVEEGFSFFCEEYGRDVYKRQTRSGFFFIPYIFFLISLLILSP